MMHSAMAKNLFLKRLEKALTQLICNRLYENEKEAKSQALALNVEEFIRENASNYTLEELKETFTSAEASIGLFFEYQNAKTICQDAEGKKEKSIDLFQLLGSKEPVFPSDRWQEPITGMEFIWVSGSSFQMGCGSWDDEGLSDEKPVHEVWIDGFWLGAYPVTVSQYIAFTKETGQNTPAWLEENGKYNIHTGNDSLYKALGNTITDDNYPIVGVSLADAMAYGKWLSQKTRLFFRLPTEAEWEYAARSGGKPEKYAGGMDVDSVAWYMDNSNGAPHPVGGKAPNGLGVYDLCGNVSEWCQDIYSKNAYRKHQQYNPLNTEDGTCHVVRGGSWQYGARDVRCSDRGLFIPEYRWCDLGFRLVRPA